MSQTTPESATVAKQIAEWRKEVARLQDLIAFAGGEAPASAANERGLQPCPFCGGAARIESNRDWHRLYAVHDEDCILDAGEADLMYPAQSGYLIRIAEDWNRRAIPQPAAEPVTWIGPHANAWEALNETRKAVADIIGANPDTWPDHGNAPLAIAAVIAIRQNAVERVDAAPDRAPSAGSATDGVRAALVEYYDALTARQHGGVAADKALNKIEQAMGMSWGEHKAKPAIAAMPKEST